MNNTTYKNTAIGLIPSDWEVTKLEKLGNIITGNTPSRNDMTLWNGNFCWASAKDFSGKYIFDTVEKITKKGCETARILPKGSILITCIASIGNNAIAAVPLATNQQINSIVVYEDCNNEWLYYQLAFYKQNLKLLASKTSIPLVNKSDFSSFKIPLPPLTEQQKIASILSTWDKAIDNCKGIIEELKIRNKGLTQKLFNKDFEKKHLSQIFERITTKNIENNQNVITISAQRGFIKQTDFFNKVIASTVLDNYTLVKKGDFCYNKSYSNGYDWGATKRLNDFEKAVVTTLYICFRIKNENQNSGDFFEYFFESGILNKGLSKVANEGGRAHGLLNVTSSDFFNIKIGVPTFEEQKAIAKILDKATEELNQYQKKLETLQLQKKGLMQQLLTGKKRVKII